MDETELRDALLSGQPRRLHLAAYAFRPRVEVLARRLLAHRTDADRELAVDHVQDMFIADDFKRLRAYRPPNKATTYLVVIGRRLLIEWSRRTEGRFHVPTAVAALGPIAAELYTARQRDNATYDEAVATVAGRHPELAPADVERLLDRVEAATPPDLRLHPGRRAATVDDEGRDVTPAASQPPQDAALALARARDKLARVWAELAPVERMILAAVFVNGLSIRKLAALLRTSEYHAGRRRDAIIEQLFAAVAPEIGDDLLQYVTAADLIPFFADLEPAPGGPEDFRDG